MIQCIKNGMNHCNVPQKVKTKSALLLFFSPISKNLTMKNQLFGAVWIVVAIESIKKLILIRMDCHATKNTVLSCDEFV